MGDFNSDLSVTELDSLLLHFNDANGWKNQWLQTAPIVEEENMVTGCIDQIFMTTNIELEDVRVVEGAPSDHDMILADVRLLDAAPVLPVQLVDNALIEARTALEEVSEAAPASRRRALAQAIEEAETTELNEDNRYPLVQRLRLRVQELYEPSDEPEIDVSLLEWLVAQCEEENSAVYQDGTWAACQKKLEQSKSILRAPQSQQQVDE